jgi:hypothetical protein
MTEFKIDTSGLKSYAATLKAAIRRFNWATAYYLTELAVDCRARQQQAIEDSMIVRDKRFVSKQLVFQKAIGRQDARHQVARAGSYESPRFSGWREQVEGGDKPRVAMTKGRTGGKQSGKMLGRVRLKPGNRFLTQHSMPIRAKDEAHRVFVFLRIMSRRAKEPFVLTSGHTRFPPGVWTLVGAHGKKRWPRPSLLQRFGANESVKKNDWNKEAANAVQRYISISTLWQRCWEKANVLRKKKKFS